MTEKSEPWKEVLEREKTTYKEIDDLVTGNIELSISKHKDFYGWVITTTGPEDEVLETTDRIDKLLREKYPDVVK